MVTGQPFHSKIFILSLTPSHSLSLSLSLPLSHSFSPILTLSPSPHPLSHSFSPILSLSPSLSLSLSRLLEVKIEQKFEIVIGADTGCCTRSAQHFSDLTSSHPRVGKKLARFPISKKRSVYIQTN